jgi:Xaa-Pro aminopeptidase
MVSIKKIQKWMKQNKKDILLINRTDEFLNEYIAPYAERLKWISNFSGSAGKAIIEQDKAYIFIDGRYTEQALQEVDIIFFEIKQLKHYWVHLKKYINQNSIIHVDPLLHSVKEIEKTNSFFFNSKVSLNFLEKNPIDLVWCNKPPPPVSKAFIHEKKYAGESSLNKIIKIQKILKLKLIDFYLLSSLDSIAWLLNLRGNDIKHTPLLLCYVIIPQKGKIELFIDISKIKHLIDGLSDLINFNCFHEIDSYLLSIDLKKIIGMDEELTPYHFKNILNNIGFITNHFENPCLYPKAIKNDIEIEGAKQANLRDGLSITRFLYWLKKKIVIKDMNEIKAADYLFKLRKKNDLFYSLSFDTISAFSSNAAMPHYSVTKETNMTFHDNSIYLVDSGAQYRDGTTDITRTIILGKPSKEQMDRYTRVLKGHIAVSRANFLLGTKGSELDYLARESLQEINCDYNHGTGHGIGSFLSVHEGPQKITKSQDKNDNIIKKGMILSNEPGYYKKNEYGIRIENLLICCSKDQDLLFFETISWAPFERDLIQISLLDEEEIKWINDYHNNVYEKISPNLNIEEKKWLKSVTNFLSS